MGILQYVVYYQSWLSLFVRMRINVFIGINIHKKYRIQN